MRSDSTKRVALYGSAIVAFSLATYATYQLAWQAGFWAGAN
jgi:hypothetical protein